MLRKYIKNAGVLTATELLLRLKGFILLPLLTRRLGTVDYGIWAQLLILVSAILPLIMLSTDSSFLRFAGGKPEKEQARTYSAWFIFLLVYSLLWMTGLCAFGGRISRVFFAKTEGLNVYIQIAALQMLLSVLILTQRNWMRLKYDAKGLSALAIFQNALTFIALFVVLVRSRDILLLLIYSLAADTVVFLVFLVRMARTGAFSRPNFSVIRPMIKFGLPLLPCAYSMWCLNWLDRMFLSKYGTMGDIGVYSLVYSLGYLVIQTVVSPIWVMYPSSATELYENGKPLELQRLFETSAGLVWAITIPAAVGLSVIGTKVLMMISTKDFARGGPLMGLITAGYLCMVMASYFETSLGLKHKQALGTVSLIIACLTNLVLNIILIPKFLIVGAALATALAFLVQLFCSYLFSLRYDCVRVRFGFPLKVLFAALVMGIAVYQASLNLRGSFAAQVVELTLLGIVVYALVLFLLKPVEENIFSHFPSRFMFREKSAG